MFRVARGPAAAAIQLFAPLPPEGGKILPTWIRDALIQTPYSYLGKWTPSYIHFYHYLFFSITSWDALIVLCNARGLEQQFHLSCFSASNWEVVACSVLLTSCSSR